MKLAKLVYEIVRDSIELPSGINFDSFIRGDFDSDRDYNSQISFAFGHINLALTRLVTNKKTLLKVVSATPETSGYVEFADGEVISVVSDLTPKYHRVHFRPFNEGVAVEAPYADKEIYIEYRPNVPHFEMDDIRQQTLDDNNEVTYEEIEIDLEDYGITDEMCSYVKEYAKGGLTEYLSPELSQRHIQMAESYFNNLKTRYTDYPQREIVDTTRGGGAW